MATRTLVMIDIFEQFLDGQGKFKSHIGTDVKGLLSLYEAAYLGKPGEDILDEAISFARSHLEFLLASHDLEPLIKIKILHALETPLRRRMQRLEARHHISIYEQDIATRNDMVLELAKLDFHILQLLHQQEIRAISMWWKEFNVPAKFTFARDRIVEIYFWMLGVSFVPHCSRSRMISSKVTALLSIMDDLYDNYGTIDELQHYTNVIQRWNLEDMEQLEECYILHFQVLTTTLREFEDELAKEGLNYRVEYLKQKEVLDWVTSFPKIIKSTTTISRLMDDIVTYEMDGYTNSKMIKDYIMLLLVERVEI